MSALLSSGHAYSPAGELRDPTSAPSRFRSCESALRFLTPRGRIVTKKGYEHVGADMPIEQSKLL